jgi:hypothetical protein
VAAEGGYGTEHLVWNPQQGFGLGFCLFIVVPVQQLCKANRGGEGRC